MKINQVISQRVGDCYYEMKLSGATAVRQGQKGSSVNVKFSDELERHRTVTLKVRNRIKERIIW